MSHTTTLNQLSVGQSAAIIDIGDIETETNLIRLGIGRGEVITCVAKIPAGPVVIRRHAIEIALGDAVSRNISISLLPAGAPA